MVLGPATTVGIIVSYVPSDFSAYIYCEVDGRRNVGYITVYT